MPKLNEEQQEIVRPVPAWWIQSQNQRNRLWTMSLVEPRKNCRGQPTATSLWSKMDWTPMKFPRLKPELKPACGQQTRVRRVRPARIRSDPHFGGEKPKMARRRLKSRGGCKASEVAQRMERHGWQLCFLANRRTGEGQSP